MCMPARSGFGVSTGGLKREMTTKNATRERLAGAVRRPSIACMKGFIYIYTRFRRVWRVLGASERERSLDAPRYCVGDWVGPPDLGSLKPMVRLDWARWSEDGRKLVRPPSICPCPTLARVGSIPQKHRDRVVRAIRRDEIEPAVPIQVADGQ